jgi:hypothetical protein
MKILGIAFLAGSLIWASGCCTCHSAKGRASDLVILKAVYGVEATNTLDVTEEVRLLAKSGPIHLHPQWALGIDPAYGKTKRITIAYRYKRRIEVASFDQFVEFSLPVNP